MAKEIDPKIVAFRISDNALTLAKDFEYLKKKKRDKLLNNIESDAELLKKL